MPTLINALTAVAVLVGFSFDNQTASAAHFHARVGGVSVSVGGHHRHGHGHKHGHPGYKILPVKYGPYIGGYPRYYPGRTVVVHRPVRYVSSVRTVVVAPTPLIYRPPALYTPPATRVVVSSSPEIAGVWYNSRGSAVVLRRSGSKVYGTLREAGRSYVLTGSIYGPTVILKSNYGHSGVGTLARDGRSIAWDWGQGTGNWVR